MFIPSLPTPVPLGALMARTPYPSLDQTFGAVLLGTFFSLMLYGVTLHQAYRYHTLYPSDRLLLKSAVYSTVILETAHMALSCHTCYFYLVTNYADPLMLQRPTTTLQGLVIGISQAFFARRAYVFGKRYRIWVFFAIFFLLGDFGFCVVSTVVEVALTNRGFSAFVPDTWIIATASAMTVCADFILTTVLIIALRRSRSGQKRTDSTLDVLVMYTITTGEFLAVGSASTSFSDLSPAPCVSMLTLFLFVVLRPADLIYTALSLVSTKLYANSLLAADQAYDSANQSGLEIQILGRTQVQQLSCTAFDQPVAIELPELPKRLRGPYDNELASPDMEAKASGGSPWSKGSIVAEGRYSESGSTIWESEPDLNSLHDVQIVATAI
ncbi:hypothetical protein LXA43DRAFT_1090354 [Ganoderma leucocontextum]|nr:hypothetical protein LXA43DRAFT_1090354 [Ganoderma leucocontextum]